MTEEMIAGSVIGDETFDIGYGGVDETIEVWHLLTEEEREKANMVADKVFEEWKSDYEKSQPNYQLNIFDIGVE